MVIKLSPSRRDETLEVEKTGVMLTLNGEDFDFSPINPGDALSATAITSGWFAGDIDNIDGELVLTLTLPLPWNYSFEQAFPVDLVNVPDGPVAFPHPLPAPATEIDSEVLE